MDTEWKRGRGGSVCSKPNMSASREVELSEHYEEILESRAEFLSGMQSRYQQESKRKQQTVEFHNAMERNRRLLEDVRKTEELLSQSHIIDPDILSLETQYWVSVEGQIPTWKSSLPGTDPAPANPGPGRPPRKAQPRAAAAKASSLPPLPRPRGPSVAHRTGEGAPKSAEDSLGSRPSPRTDSKVLN